ncbi:hypothetical protein SDJN02_11544, partial [Cucurbita argyrosperma subsp. argyrosperma]
MQSLLHPTHLDLHLKSGRRPLQPRNSLSNHVPAVAKIVKSKAERVEIPLSGDANKENVPPIHATATRTESCDLSLADELNAVKMKLERLRLDGERTEKMLRERDMVLEMRRKEILQRSEVQRDLEMEVDRLFRLKELRSYCMRISPKRSLREKEREKIFTDLQFQEFEISDEEESIDENSSSDSSEFVIGI